MARIEARFRRIARLAPLILLGAACGSEDEPNAPGGMNAAGTMNGPLGISSALGEFCHWADPERPPPVCDEGRGTCVFTGGYEYCTNTCEAQSDCASGLRCTDTGLERACLPRCKTGKDCPGVGGATCAQAGSEGDRVCWFGNDSTGELTLDKKPVLKSLDWVACIDCVAMPEAKPNWRFTPGTTAYMQILIVNHGSKTMAGELTLQSKSPLLAVAWAQVPAPRSDVYGLFPHDYPGSLQTGNELGTGGVVEAQISPDAPYGEPLPFEIVLDEYDGESFVIDFAPRPLAPVVDFALAAPAISEETDPAFVSLFIANVGDGAATGLTVTSLSLPEGTNVVVAPELAAGTASVTDGWDTPALLPLGSANIGFGLFPNPAVSVDLHDDTGRMWTVSGTITKPGN